jgi:hypothetical protein
MKLPKSKMPLPKLRLRISTSSLTLLFASLVSSSALGQLPNQSKSSPLNYLARFHGIGYSDGYHSCPNNQCAPNRSWAKPASFSSLYGEPTPPPGPRFHRPAPSYSVYQSYDQGIEMIVTPQVSQPSQHAPAMQLAPPPSMNSTLDYPSAIPRHSILLQNDSPAGGPPSMANPGRTDQWGAGPSELIPPPQPSRAPQQTRRAIPGTTRPYHANLPTATNRR